MVRILALACILASMPVACVKYPWLPSTVAEFAQLQIESRSAEGTESYNVDRVHRRNRLVHALVLYALGSASLVGLAAVALGGCSRKIEATAWIFSAVTGAAIAQFEQTRIAPNTDQTYVLVMTYLPLGIATMAGAAAVITLASPRSDSTDTLM